MKSLFIFLSALLLTSIGFASTVISLPGRKASLGASGDLPVLIDLSAELQKKKLDQALEKTRLIQVDVIAQAGPTGAIYALMMSGAAVDSATVTDDKSSTITLVPDSDSTPGPWVLGVRGDVDIKEIRVTIEASNKPATPPTKTPPVQAEEPSPPVKEEPPVREEPPVQKEEPPVQKEPIPREEPVRGDNDLIGRKVIVVSRTTGRIDYVVVLRQDRDGTFTVRFQGMEYDGFERKQIGLIEGCTESLCVGQSIQMKGRKARVLARLSDGSFVVEDNKGERFIYQREAAKSQLPPKTNPALFTVLRPGQVVLIVQENSDVFPAQVLRTSPESAWVRSFGKTAREIRITNAQSLAVLSGCLNGLCVGDPVTATDDRGRKHPAEILGIQDGSRFVIRLFPDGWEVGNWPANAVRPALLKLKEVPEEPLFNSWGKGR